LFDGLEEVYFECAEDPHRASNVPMSRPPDSGDFLGRMHKHQSY
jgi:hypothetical protein